MEDIFQRTEMLLGKANINLLKNKRVAVFGLGGVGGYICEGLVRAGLGNIDICDNDIISPSNLNRQIIALQSTIWKNKTDVMEKHLLDINPDLVINKYNIFFSPKISSLFPFDKYDYIVDAVDNVTAKIELVLRAKEFNKPIISCMGTGNKLNPTLFKVSDIYKTSVCPLAKVMRKELRKREIESLKVVYSEEEPIKVNSIGEKIVPGSISFVPPVEGLIVASEVIKDLINL
ncbi:MAG: tRNA threonylcarbamoyladenosine dehydratase [Clostridia bacterium]|nr:tRNA threonylcarbamoyladenosine dehydratase [Clostridia bacterium]